MAAAVSSDVSGARMTSTSDMTGTGLKKCMPITRSGRPVAAASVAMGMEEVLDARIASGGGRLSAVLKIASFTETSSTTASIMSSASTMPSTGSTRASTSSGSAPPFSASFSEAAPHRLQAALDRSRRRVVKRDATARGRQHLGDAAAHLAGADNEYVVERHEARG